MTGLTWTLSGPPLHMPSPQIQRVCWWRQKSCTIFGKKVQVSISCSFFASIGWPDKETQMGIWLELGVFALVFLFAIHQFHDLKQEKKKRELLRQQAEENSEGENAKWQRQRKWWAMVTPMPLWRIVLPTSNRAVRLSVFSFKGKKCSVTSWWVPMTSKPLASFMTPC